MVDMGIKPYAIASTVSLIIAQRLARRLCTNCKESVDVPKEALLKEGFSKVDVKENFTIFTANVGLHLSQARAGRLPSDDEAYRWTDGLLRS